ncbi:hypothetical protein LLF64_24030 [Escherichia coli]|nr:hypothetical protein [Escherichia coli]
MSVIQWWLTYFYNAASEYLISTRQMSCRFIKSTNSGLFLKLLSSSDLLRRDEGWLYLAVVIDLWSRAVIGKRKLTAVCSHQTRIGNLDAHLI